MRTISRARWFLSGLMAGMVIDSIQYLLDSFVFSDNWDALAKLATPDPTKAVFAVTATKLVAGMQLVGLLAGMLAVRLGGPPSKRKHAPARSAAIAWLFTYGLVCAALFLISRGVTDPGQRPVNFMHGIGFAVAGFAGCWAGSRFGNWVYRESEAAAAEKAAGT